MKDKRLSDKSRDNFILSLFKRKEDSLRTVDIVILIAAILCAIAVVLIGCEAWADEIYDLVPYIIQVESGGRADAVSPAGAIGLMQITPNGALKEWNNFNYEYKEGNTRINCKFAKGALYDPVVNKQIGTWYLRRLKDHYLKDDYTVERLLASYNGGITRMRRLLRQGKDWQDMPKESRDYVRKVLKLYRRAI